MVEIGLHEMMRTAVERDLLDRVPVQPPEQRRVLACTCAKKRRQPRAWADETARRISEVPSAQILR